MFASGKTGNHCQQKTSQPKTTATVRHWGCFCHVSVHALWTVFHNPTLFATGLHGAGGVPTSSSCAPRTITLAAAFLPPSSVLSCRNAIAMGIEDQLKKSQNSWAVCPCTVCPLTFCKTSFELVDRHAPLLHWTDTLGVSRRSGTRGRGPTRRCACRRTP